MPPERSWRLRIQDILDAVAKTQSYTTGMDRETFLADQRTADAVIRQLTIVGEAATHIPGKISNRHPEIPWRMMRDFRNFVVHAYFGVDLKIVWDTIQNDLPPLEAQLRPLLATTDE